MNYLNLVYVEISGEAVWLVNTEEYYGNNIAPLLSQDQKEERDAEKLL